MMIWGWQIARGCAQAQPIACCWMMWGCWYCRCSIVHLSSVAIFIQTMFWYPRFYGDFFIEKFGWCYYRCYFSGQQSKQLTMFTNAIPRKQRVAKYRNALEYCKEAWRTTHERNLHLLPYNTMCELIYGSVFDIEKGLYPEFDELSAEFGEKPYYEMRLFFMSEENIRSFKSGAAIYADPDHWLLRAAFLELCIESAMNKLVEP